MIPPMTSSESGAPRPIPAPAGNRFIWSVARGFAYVYAGSWLLGASRVIWGDDADLWRVIRGTFFFALIGALLSPVVAIAWRLIRTRILPPLLALDEPAARRLDEALTNPLMRVLVLVFAGTWLFWFGYASRFGDQMSVAIATQNAAIATLGTLVAVTLWRLATARRD